MDTMIHQENPALEHLAARIGKFCTIIMGILVVPVMLSLNTFYVTLSLQQALKTLPAAMLIAGSLAYVLAYVASYVASPKLLAVKRYAAAIAVWALPLPFLVIALLGYAWAPELH